jgi:hypothetical protein
LDGLRRWTSAAAIAGNSARDGCRQLGRFGKIPIGEELIDFWHAALHLGHAIAAAYGDGTPKARHRFAELRDWSQSQRFDEAWALVASTYKLQVTTPDNVIPI